MTGLLCRRSLRALCLLFVGLLLHGQTSANLPEARTQRGGRARVARVTRADVDHDAEASLVGQAASRLSAESPDGLPDPHLIGPAARLFAPPVPAVVAALLLGPLPPRTGLRPARRGRGPPSLSVLLPHA